MPEHETPRSPEEYPEEVREELDQTEVSHLGTARTGGDQTMGNHLGAVETETASVTPPMDGPSELTQGTLEDEGIEPREELHGG